ncbi:MAG TPA: hypothetical protein VFH20_13440 [Propionibacteriaceae bacterium]|nr:hypothetical protein [Propionibacteriaceae bacterium]
MRSRAARTVILIIGGLAVLVGGVWIGQVAGLIKGSLHDRQSHLARYRTALFRHWRVLDLLGGTPPLR